MRAARKRLLELRGRRQVELAANDESDAGFIVSNGVG
jgi:hypothetical protein